MAFIRVCSGVCVCGVLLCGRILHDSISTYHWHCNIPFLTCSLLTPFCQYPLFLVLFLLPLLLPLLLHLSSIGTFRKGMKVGHSRMKRTINLSSAQALFAQDRESITEAYPGDVIGACVLDTDKDHTKYIIQYFPYLTISISFSIFISFSFIIIIPTVELYHNLDSRTTVVVSLNLSLSVCVCVSLSHSISLFFSCLLFSSLLLIFSNKIDCDSSSSLHFTFQLRTLQLLTSQLLKVSIILATLLSETQYILEEGEYLTRVFLLFPQRNLLI